MQFLLTLLFLNPRFAVVLLQAVTAKPEYARFKEFFLVNFGCTETLFCIDKLAPSAEILLVDLYHSLAFVAGRVRQRFLLS